MSDVKTVLPDVVDPEKPFVIEETLGFLGDSHAWTMFQCAQKGFFGKVRFKPMYVGAATASGLQHPRSKTQALVKFREYLFPYQPDLIPIFQLGEVDCGFLLWYRAEKYNDPIMKHLEGSIDAYMNFLIECRDAGYTNLIVTAAVLPTFRDGEILGEVAHMRAEVKATQHQRTDLTLIYNERLKQRCRDEGLDFVDSTIAFLDFETRLVKDQFRRAGGKDHHLVVGKAGHVWGRHIMGAIQQRKALVEAQRTVDQITDLPVSLALSPAG